MKSVTTIIPAYNVAATLDRTLRSALEQTYPSHEIIIVNDGSTDTTGDIAKMHAKRHGNIRVVEQENRGLSGARNRGIDAATGDFVAPLDADDVWHPEKLARQVTAIERVSGAALAYGWFRRIDEQDRVLPGSASPVVEGRVFHRHLDQNFISNGSSPLIRTDVARAVRYDESFNSCEDYLLQLQIARHHPFACAPAYLTGYRLSQASMSRNVGRMIVAHLRMFALIRQDADEAARRIIDRRVAALEVELARNRGRRGASGEAARALVRGFVTDPAAAARAMVGEARLAIGRAGRPMFQPPADMFEAYAAETPDGPWTSGRSSARDAALAALDAGNG